MSVPLEAFKRAIVRILDAHARLQGLGLLVDPQWVLTCAHVAAAASGGEADAVHAPAGGVLVDLPFVGVERVRARVPGDHVWYRSSDLDLTLLYLDVPLAATGYAHLSPALSLFRMKFEGWGAPDGHERHLIPISGRLEQEISNGRYVANLRGSNYMIQPGCSGAPLVDSETGLVLGLVVQQELEKDAEAGFVVPASHLRRVLRDASVGVPDAEDQELSALLPWLDTRYRGCFKLRDAVRRFISSYRSKPGEPRPFAGRVLQLQLLDQWLLRPSDRLLLISGPAGRGKSALLLHWLARQVHRNTGLVIFYLPISIRFGIADERSGAELLFASLCDVFSDLEANFTKTPLVKDYVDRIAAGWRHIEARPDQSFLLVVDGLDEAVELWFLKQRVLPPELPANLHVLISARHKPGHEDGAAWLQELEVPRDCTSLLEIAALDRAATAEAIVQLGRPLDQLAEREGIVDELFRLTDQGDPLLLTLWLGQLWERRDAAPNLNVRALARLAPSFTGFYGLWVRDQKNLWEAHQLSVPPEQFEPVMHLLALARGPLLLSELVALLSESPHAARWNESDLRRTLELSHRLIVGDAEPNGYVLVHPRLAQHFQTYLAVHPGKLRAMRAAFLSWGEKTVHALNSGQLPPEECSHYLLRHYVTAHLETERVISSADLAKYHVPLLQRGWPLAWHAYEGSWQGYLNDLDRIATALRLHNQSVRSPQELHLAEEVRIALIRASIHSMTTNLPVELVVAPVAAGLWSLARGVRVATLFEPQRRTACLVKLAAMAEKLEGPAAAVAVWSQALEAAEATQDDGTRHGVLMALPAETGLLQAALQSTAAIQDGGMRAEVLVALAVQWPGEAELLQRALQATWMIQDPCSRVRALVALTAGLQGQQRYAVMQQALQVTATTWHERERADALETLAPALHGELLQQALAIAREIRKAGPRTYAFAAVAGHLPAEQRRAVIQEALHAVVLIDNESSRVAALQALVTQLRGDAALLQRALRIAAVIWDEGERARALLLLASQLRGEQRQAVMKQTWEAAAAIRNERTRGEAFLVLAGQLDGDQQQLAIEQALRAAVAIQGERERATALQAVVGRLQTEAQFHQVLQAATAIEDEPQRARALKTVVVQLQGEAQFYKVLQATPAIGDEPQRARALCTVAGQLHGDGALLESALQAAAVQSNGLRIDVLMTLVRHLDESQRRVIVQQALQAAAAIQEEDSRARALMTIAAQLKSGQRDSVVRQALRAASAIQEEGSRAEVLAAVAMQLQEDPALLDEVLLAGRAIHDQHARGDALLAVAAQLQGQPRHAVLRQVIAVAAAIRDERARAAAFVMMSKTLRWDANLSQLVLQTATAIENEFERARVLEVMATKLQGDAGLLEQAFEAITGIRDESARARVLVAVTGQLCGEAALLERASQVADGIRYEGASTDAFLAIAMQLQGGQRRAMLLRALRAAAAIDEDYTRASALEALAPQLKGDAAMLQQALRAAMAIEEELLRVRVLVSLAEHLRGEAELLQQVLHAAAAIEDEHSRASVLVSVAEQLQGAVGPLQQVLEAAATVGDSHVSVLLAVAEHLQGGRREDVLQQALLAAATFEHAATRVRWLSAVVEQVQEERRQVVFRQVLQAAAMIRGEFDRAFMLVEVSTWFQSEGALLLQVLQAGATVLDEREHAYLLESVIRRLLGEIPKGVIDRVLEAAATIEDGSLRASVLVAVAERLGGERHRDVLERALQAAVTMEDEGDRAHVLASIAARLEGETRFAVIDQAMLAIAGCQCDDARVRALRKLVVQLHSEAEHLEFLQAAAAIQSEQLRAELLLTLSAQLQGERRREVLQQALQAAMAIPGEYSRGAVLADVAAQLQEQQLHTVFQRALCAAAATQDAGERSQAIRAVGIRLARYLDVRDLTYDLWLDLIPIGGVARASLVESVGVLTYCARELTGRTTDAEAIAQAVFDVGEWWP